MSDLVIARVVDGHLEPMAEKPPGIPVVVTPSADCIETLAVVKYPDGRTWEVRIHHREWRKGEWASWGPSVWTRMVKS